MERKTERIRMYTRFERFWHWAQAVLVILLLATGLETHGLYGILGYEKATEWHNALGIGWMVLYVFILFWLATTGEWKQYVPTTKRLMAMARYYAFGIFRGEESPVAKSREAKLNPLQRLTYVAISLVLIPFQIATGLMYYTYSTWSARGWDLSLGEVAGLHTAGAYAFLAFLVVHVYMTTTGHRVLSHIKAMITGWEDVPVRK
ncbi:MAG: cytochrome b/b6 domain-containing protein [Thermodesulfobacteriota bacterium]